MALWAVILLAICGVALLLMLVIVLVVLLWPMNAEQRKVYQRQMHHHIQDRAQSKPQSNPYLGKILLP